MKKRKILSFALALSLCLGLCLPAAAAEDGLRNTETLSSGVTISDFIGKETKTIPFYEVEWVAAGNGEMLGVETPKERTITIYYIDPENDIRFSFPSGWGHYVSFYRLDDGIYRQMMGYSTPRLEDESWNANLKFYDDGTIAQVTVVRPNEYKDAAETVYIQQYMGDTAAPAFTDVPSTHWAAGYISYVVDKGLFSGTSATAFTPDGKITQAQMSVVLGRYAGQDIDGGETWYSKAMDWASANGIISTRQPDHQLTREEFADMMYRFAKYANKDTTIRDGVLDGYADTGSLSGGYTEAMRWAVSVGLITGTDATHLSPQNLVTRAQVATMLTRYDGGNV